MCIPDFSNFLECFLDFWCDSRVLFTAFIEILQTLQNADWEFSGSFSIQSAKNDKTLKINMIVYATVIKNINV